MERLEVAQDLHFGKSDILFRFQGHQGGVFQLANTSQTSIVLRGVRKRSLEGLHDSTVVPLTELQAECHHVPPLSSPPFEGFQRVGELDELIGAAISLART